MEAEMKLLSMFRQDVCRQSCTLYKILRDILQIDLGTVNLHDYLI